MKKVKNLFSCIGNLLKRNYKKLIVFLYIALGIITFLWTPPLEWLSPWTLTLYKQIFLTSYLIFGLGLLIFLPKREWLDGWSLSKITMQWALIVFLIVGVSVVVFRKNNEPHELEFLGKVTIALIGALSLFWNDKQWVLFLFSWLKEKTHSLSKFIIQVALALYLIAGLYYIVFKDTIEIHIIIFTGGVIAILVGTLIVNWKISAGK